MSNNITISDVAEALGVFKDNSKQGYIGKGQDRRCKQEKECLNIYRSMIIT